MTDDEADALAVERFKKHLQVSAIPRWIRKSVPMLGNQRPIDLIKDGKIDWVEKKLDDELNNWDGLA